MSSAAAPGARLFIGNLSWNTTDDTLRIAFSEMGTITDSKVIMDRYTGRSRGFGFVTFETADQADKAMTEMNGVQVDGREVRVDKASDRNN